MASIVSIRQRSIPYSDIKGWLDNNVNDFVLTNISVTFLHDHDASAFILRFGFPNATQNPALLNRHRKL